MSTKGTRVYGRVPTEPGEYGDWGGHWWGKPPVRGCPAGMLCDHEVTEHDDGTITVNPSILMPSRYHGWLRRGEWTEG